MPFSCRKNRKVEATTMENKNLELLFEYLRSILFDTHIQPLDLDLLEEPYQKLGQGLAFLQEEVEQLKAYSKDLAAGNLSCEQPPKENQLCADLKNIHAALHHLTWQANRVAQGDYSQRVSFLGSFSDAFNTMIEQLQERETFLKESAAQEQQRTKIVQGYNELLTEMTRKRKEWVLIADIQKKELLYCNKQHNIGKLDIEFCKSCPYRLPFHDEIPNWQRESDLYVWEMEHIDGMNARITTFPLEWQGSQALAHIIDDITHQANTTKELTNKAYRDAMTGVYNRAFFEEYMKKVLEERRQAILIYIDLDKLKAVNDQYGHQEGDSYILHFVHTIQKYFNPYDIFSRVGGDEFVLVLEKIQKEQAVSKIRQALLEFKECSDRQYLCSFSYGVVSIKEDEPKSLQALLQEADTIMYECKRQNKLHRT